MYQDSVKLIPFMQENTDLDKDETLAILVNMGYPFEEALIAIDKCGKFNV